MRTCLVINSDLDVRRVYSCEPNFYVGSAEEKRKTNPSTGGITTEWKCSKRVFIVVFNFLNIYPLNRYANSCIMAPSNFCLFVIILLSTVYVDSSKLNVPRVLLPLFSDVSTNFTLEVTDGGCYKWFVPCDTFSFSFFQWWHFLLLSNIYIFWLQRISSPIDFITYKLY